MFRTTLACAVCVFISSFACLTPDQVLGSQLTKGNRLVLQQREVRNYERPRRNGNRIAFCTAGGQCGKHAADEYCRENDFEGALTFQRDRMEGHSAQMRFLRIKCWRSKVRAVGKQTHAPEVAGRKLISNTSIKSNRR